MTAIDIEGLTGKGLSWEELQFVPVKLSRVGEAYAGPTPGCPVEEFWLLEIGGADGTGRLLYGSALQAITQAVSQAYVKRRLAAVRVTITESDLRRLLDPESDGVLTVHVTEGVVSQLRSVVKREGKPYEGSGSIYKKILEESPVEKGSLVDLNRLDPYVYRLNRHPGRRVDVALAPGKQPGELSLDFVVNEAKPYLLYAHVSNTGTEETSTLRERLGLTHYNLTGHDDIASLVYVTGDFDRVHALVGSYQRPLGGIESLWAKVYGSYSKFDASEVGVLELDYLGEHVSGGCELGANIFQEKSFFVDVAGGISYWKVKIENLLIWDGQAEEQFLVPYMSVRAEDRKGTSSFSGSVTFEANAADLAGTTKERVRELGRSEAQEDWARLRYEGSWSAFLEPLFQKTWPPEGTATLAHELAARLHGQYTFDIRVAPLFVQTVGGFYSVRGYPEAFASGDLGAAGSLEYRLHVPRLFRPGEPMELLGRRFQLRPQRPLDRPDWDLILTVFCDASYTRHHNRLSYERNLLLLGSGVGAELSLLRNLQCRCDWGIPLRDAFNGEEEVRSGSGRLHFSLAVYW